MDFVSDTLCDGGRVRSITIDAGRVFARVPPGANLHRNLSLVDAQKTVEIESGLQRGAASSFGRFTPAEFCRATSNGARGEAAAPPAYRRDRTYSSGTSRPSPYKQKELAPLTSLTSRINTHNHSNERSNRDT